MSYSVRTKDGIVIDGIPDNVSPDDPSVKQRVNRARAQRQIENDPITKGAKDFNADSGFFNNLASGAGKAVSDTWLGLRQLTGNASQAEVDEAAARDKQLMNTGGGIVGNVGTQIGAALLPGGLLSAGGKLAGAPGVAAAGRYLLSSPATMGGLLTQGALGGIQAGIQPVTSDESRGRNATLGAVGGALVPAVGLISKTISAGVQPLYQGGQEQIVGNAIRNAAGGQADEAVRSLQGARQLVPGSHPTAGQAANNAGIAALERTASAIDPSVTVAYQQRMAQQNAARVDSLLDMAGSSGARTAAEKARDKTANKLYGEARKQGVDPVMADALKPQVKNLLERVPKGVVEHAQELARISNETMGMEGSINGLHWMKIAVDDLLSSGKQTGIGKEMKRALTQYQDDLKTVIDDLSPAYAKARAKFAEMSAPINQMEVAGEVAKRSIRPLDSTLTPSMYARALADEGLPAKATGFKGSTWQNTMTPGQMNALTAIKDDLARANFAQTAGRGVGSDTVQKLAYSNLVENAGIPTWLRSMAIPQAVGGAAARGADMLYGRANREIAGLLANGLLDPQEAARLMMLAAPSARGQAIGRGLLSVGSPTAIGATTGLLNVQ